MRECENCGKSMVWRNAQARYCSTRCRVAAHRAGGLAQLRKLDRWVLWDEHKRPRQTSGALASSTDPTTWTSYRNVAGQPRVGFVLGEGIACIDLDHCLVDGEPNEVAAAFLKTVPHHLIEVSPSGDGLHIWGTAEASRGTRQEVDGLKYERYTTGRYITVTGNIYQHGRLLPL